MTTGDPEPARATGSTDGGDHRGVGPALHRERLWPGPWVWIGAAGVAASLGIAYGAAFGPVSGWAISAAIAAAAVLVIWRTSVTVIVGEDGLRADRASLPWWATGQVLVLDAAGVRHARGPDGDPTAYSVMRAGVGPGAIVLEITDPEDPHATWLIGSRDAEAMARAIRRARGRLTP